MKETNTTSTPIGALWNEQENSCLFSIWAPDATSVQVEIVNKGKTYFLQPKSYGYWSSAVVDAKPGDRYLLIIDDHNKKPDPASRFQPEGVHGPSEIADPFFQWSDDSWKGLPLAQMIIYELHVGTFTDGGTFGALVSKLDYLKDLGINTIELMPIAQFPGNRNWGYDGVYPFAVQASYGGPAELKKLIDTCHAKGLAVVLDVVYNHLGPEGNYLGDFAPYFTGKYKTPWGKAINFDDTYCDGVRNYFIQNALMWLDEYHFDGLRLDAVHAIYDFSAHHIMKELHERVAQLEKKNNKKYVLIAESDLNNALYISPVQEGGYGLDGQWCDDFHHSVHTLISHEREGYYVDFGTIDHLAKALKHSYVYNGNYSPSRKRNYGNSADERPFSQFVFCIQNHDQIGNRLEGDRLSKNVSYERLKLAATFLLLSPSVPMLFMGEEYAEKNPFQYFISHGDPQLVEAVRKGRRQEFSSFKWEGHVPDPQSEETFNKCKLSWNFGNDAKQSAMLQLYKFLIALRKNHPALQSDQRSSLEVYPDNDKNIVAFKRTVAGNVMVVIGNFSDNDQLFTINAAESNFTKLFDTADAQWLGSGSKSPEIVDNKSQGIVSKTSAVVYELKI